MQTRDAVRQSIAAYTNALECSGDRGLAPFIGALRRLDASSAVTPRERPMTNPTLRHLPKALSGLRGDDRLARAIREITRHIRWASSYAAGGKVGYLASQMVWGEIAGLRGLVRAPDVRHGCFLLSPGMLYPVHGHVAEEIYYVVSGNMVVEHGLDNARVRVGPGQYYHTPPSHPHALHVGDEPLLIVYFWVGDLAPPVWFYEKDPKGEWVKFYPEFARG